MSEPTGWRRLRLAAALGAGALGALAPSASADQLPRMSVSVRGAIPDHEKRAGRLVIRDGGRTVFRGRIGIERRGQSSQAFPKKGYGFELRTRDGDNRDAALLGMPADDDWVLHAAYNDKTLMRNALAYATARRMGRYASRTRFVELRLDGRRHGVYVLMEKLKLHDDRIDVEEPGQLVEWTFGWQVRQKRERSFRLPVSGYHILFEDPERDDLGPERIRAVRAELSAAERALYGDGFRRPATGWRAHLDEGAAVDFLLVNELFKNQDAFRASTYLHRPEDGRWTLGPVWDFDISMGNSDYGESARLRGPMLAKRSWGGRFYEDPALVAAMRARWRELREGGLKGWLLRTVDQTAGRLRRTGAAGRNFRRWPVLGVRVWPNPPAAVRRTTYGAEVRALRSWLVRRVAWLDRNVGRF
ncbi:MAG TPA: CotH kinase family protein [Solirubrobacteraceae bacterium]|nr:CotH kinase family protein [Solirubrobacteraceae bacterium]